MRLLEDELIALRRDLRATLRAYAVRLEIDLAETTAAVGTYRPVETLSAGAVIKSRVPTGEVLATNAAGRDAIVSRVIWLRGTEIANRNARERCIYIHGTAEEKLIGRRASFGCIRMRSRDVINLYGRVHIGTHLQITEKPLSDCLPVEAQTVLARSDG